MLLKEAASNPESHPPLPSVSSARESDCSSAERDSVHFKNDCMYRHHLARFNYTTYDVRRAQDVINPGTSHRDILLLAKNVEDCSDHPFLYARVIGIYHVNVVYTGLGMLDYEARKIDFLWVRWFKYNGRSVRWEDLKLDSIRFPPMAMSGSFGFVDPKDVLRGCHIIPTFAKRKVHKDEVALSRLAGDAHDWSCYYVDRCVKTESFFIYI